MADLVLPHGTVPSNLMMPPDRRHVMVETDVFNICQRVREIDPNLKIIWFDREKDPYVVMETSIDGIERWVCATDALDERLLRKLQHMIGVPFEKRFEEAEKANEAFEKATREREFEELYERMARPMWTQLEHDGFIQRPVSYAKKGVRSEPHRA